MAGVDSPALAGPGPFAVGLERATFTQPRRADPLAFDPVAKTLPVRDRILPVEIWYPATPAPGSAPVGYAGALTGENGADVAFTLPGVAVLGAQPRAGPFPLVILAHGFGGDPVALRWLAENLASKGYVVVGPHFGDPPITDGSRFIGPLAGRPLDIAFVAAEAVRRAGAHLGALAAADPSRLALIGYSMGGYGALTDAGAGLDPALGPATHGALTPFVAGGPRAAELKVSHLAAVVAIAPASRFAATPAWAPGALAAVTAPTLFIVGNQDTIVGYDPGVKSLFEAETHAPRYLLTFQNAGHSIGMDAAPPTMRGALWDLDWWEDPVWRKERLADIQRHFITAFLDRYVKGDASSAGWLDVATPLGAAGGWTPPAATPYGALSPGAPATLWKGFARGHAVGLELRFAPPATAPSR